MTGATVHVDEITTALECLRKYEFEFQQSIDTTGPGDVRDRREALFRNVLTAAFERASAEDSAGLLSVAMDEFEDRWAAHTAGAQYQSAAQRRYDRQAARAAIEGYVSRDGSDHLDRYRSAGETLSFSRDAVDFEVVCDVDLILDSATGSGVEIVRFVPTLQGIIWPYDGGSHPVDDLANGDYSYARQKASVLRAVANRIAVFRAFLDDPFVDVEFRYVALAAETYPIGSVGSADGSAAAIGATRDLTAYVNPANTSNTAGSEFEARIDTGEAVLYRLGRTIRSGEYDPDRQDFEQVYEHVCEYCKFQDMCPDFLNEEVRF